MAAVHEGTLCNNRPANISASDAVNATKVGSEATGGGIFAMSGSDLVQS